MIFIILLEKHISSSTNIDLVKSNTSGLKYQVAIKILLHSNQVFCCCQTGVSYKYDQISDYIDKKSSAVLCQAQDKLELIAFGLKVSIISLFKKYCV